MLISIAFIVDTNVALSLKEWVDVKSRGGWLSRELSKKVNKFLLHGNCEVLLISKKDNSSLGY